MGVKGNIHPKRESEIKKDLGNRNLLVYVVSGIGVGSQGVKKIRPTFVKKIGLVMGSFQSQVRIPGFASS